MDGDSSVTARLGRWARLVGESGLDGWLVADFRWSSPVFGRLLGLTSGVLSRRCFLWIPSEGEPTVLASVVDGATFARLDCSVVLYRGFDDMVSSLRSMLPTGGATIAMEYSEDGRLPTVSRVDAGMVEMIRECGATVVSSGSLIAGLEVWDARQQELHEKAARAVDEARRLALRRVSDSLRDGRSETEGSIAGFIAGYFEQNGIAGGENPDVAVGAHAADPHYGTAGGEGARIEADMVLLIDLWGRVQDAVGAPLADSTWMAYTGAAPSDDLVHVFNVTRAARDEALAAVTAAASARRPIAGAEVDRIARAVVDRAGMLDLVLHRTGHSLGTDHTHGMGTNLDSVEFPDDRTILPGSGFTVEPGLYLPGRFGMRLEVSAVMRESDVRVTTELQQELTRLSS